MLLYLSMLPKFLKKYFWDVDFGALDLAKNRVFVLKRMLEYGDEKAVAWMWIHFKKDEVKNALCRFRGYSKKSANYWATLLEIPREEVLCLKTPSSENQKTIWPY